MLWALPQECGHQAVKQRALGSGKPLCAENAGCSSRLER